MWDDSKDDFMGNKHFVDDSSLRAYPYPKPA